MADPRPTKLTRSPTFLPPDLPVESVTSIVESLITAPQFSAPGDTSITFSPPEPTPTDPLPPPTLIGTSASVTPSGAYPPSPSTYALSSQSSRPFSSSDGTSRTTSHSSLAATASPESPTSPPDSSAVYAPTTFVTTIDGKETTIVSEFLVPPTSLASSRTSQTSRRTPIIVGSTLASLVLFIMALSLIFLRRRNQRNQYRLTEAITARQKEQSFRAMLLHGEDLGDHPRSYRNREFAPIPSRIANPSPRPSPPPTPPTADIHSLSMRHIQSPSPPILLRSRGSETGSIFHEDVWPPPAETSRLVDPIVQASSQIDLSSIVDDVMGPSDRPNRSSFAYTADDDDDAGTDGELSPTTHLFVPPHSYRQSIASSIRTTATSNPGYDYSHTASSNASQTRLWTSDSSSSLPQQNYHRYSSPLRYSAVDMSSGDRAGDRSSTTQARDSRLWIDRSPKRTSFKFGTDSS